MKSDFFNWLKSRTQEVTDIIRSPRKAFVFLLLLFAFGLSLNLGYYWFVYLGTHIITEDAYIEADIFPVNSRLMGYVNKVNVEEGSVVHKDDVLAEIDDTDVRVELSFKEMKFKKAEGDLSRAEKLHDAKALSQFDYENATAAFKASEVDLEATKLKLKYTRVLASADGVVAKKALLPGQFIQPGQSLFVIIDGTHPWVRASYKETQIQHIHPGSEVKIHVDAFPEMILIGRVESIYPSSTAKLSILPPENSTGNFTKIVQRIPLRISLDLGKNKLVLRPGMSVTASINISKDDDDGIVHSLTNVLSGIFFPSESDEPAVAFEYDSEKAKASSDRAANKSKKRDAASETESTEK